MFKVTPIGSCRITGPLRLGQEKYGLDLNLGRTYGYCHSPAEAIQLAHFLQGNISIPEDIWPLISPKRMQSEMQAQYHNASDLYVIELASAKEISIDGISIQLNYLNSTYRAFFSDPERSQEFWLRAEAGDAAEIEAFLAETWHATPEQHADSRMLARIRLQMVTEASLARDVRALAEMLPGVLFVTHVDARKPDGETIGTRSDFIRMVSQQVSRAGLPCFDPTDLMEEFGQAAAIEDHSTSLAHFTPEFSEALMEHWLHTTVAAMTDEAILRGEPKQPHLERQIDIARREGHFAHARARLQRLAEHTEHAARLSQRFAPAHADAQAAFDARAKDAPAAERVSVAARLGLFEHALEHAQAAQGGLTTLPVRTLMQAARLAGEAQEPNAAFAFAHAAFRQNNALPTAIRMLGDLVSAGPLKAFAELNFEDTAHLIARFAPVHRLRILQGQGAPVTDAISYETSTRELSDLVTELSDQGRIDLAIALISEWRALTDADRIRDRALVETLDGWVEAALTLPDLAERIEVLNVIGEADPRHAGLRKAMQTSKVDLIQRIRDAGKAGDATTLAALRLEVTRFPAPLPEFDLWRARLAFDAGEFENALDYGQAAATHLPQTINIWVLLMRAAVKLSHSAKAMEFAANVVGLSSDKTQNLRAEANEILNTARLEA